MPDMPEEFTRDFIDDFLKTLPVEKRLQGVSEEELLQGVSVEARLKGLSVEARLKGLSVEEIIAALSPEAREVLTRRLTDDGSPPTPESSH